ncbi:threo-3-hydroxy-L-aspartate ammonia-lyase [Sporolituus thermophilus]|uniref:threonine ammonia-lyase n=1 Tax=Sporolituus thermophilus DSM 23256 TaxID=1123285 RepID=A0A1G7KHY0_9FIRM|nr:threo-3-hydroxy-L-aspartate ammonia-lyase [Sporolituus thermophilus]SDF36792.1 L-threonine ammonia-lyase [Sporolituus thermophilus DSM 23256]
MYEQIAAAASRLAGVAHKTPVLTSRLLDERTGNMVFLKCENFQRMGAFKFRGAYNAISCLSAAQREKGVIAYSSGNHAQAVALASKLLGVKATVIVPADAPAVKLAAAKDYGADIITYDRATVSREEVAAKLIREHGYTLIPPFDHYDVIAGQGTAAKELIEEVLSLDYLFVQVGGGGLLSGCAVAAKHLLPHCQVIGVEPALADDATRSFKSGELQSVHNPPTIADGLRTASLGKLTFPLIRQYVDDMVTVSEEEIIRTMEFLWTRLKIVVEPSGAVSLAPLMHRKFPIEGKRVGVILSGGNVDIRQAGELFATIQNA